MTYTIVVTHLSCSVVIPCLKSGVRVFLSLKSVNSRLTRHSRSGKQGRLGPRNWNKRKVTQSLVEKYTFYIIFNNIGHDGKFKQIMPFRADFHAGPSKESNIH